MPIKILKYSKFCFHELTDYINESLTHNKCPDTLKISGIIPIFKKFGPSVKAIYRLVNILPLLSNVFK